MSGSLCCISHWIAHKVLAIDAHSISQHKTLLLLKSAVVWDGWGALRDKSSGLCMHSCRPSAMPTVQHLNCDRCGKDFLSSRDWCVPHWVRQRQPLPYLQQQHTTGQRTRPCLMRWVSILIVYIARLWRFCLHTCILTGCDHDRKDFGGKTCKTSFRGNKTIHLIFMKHHLCLNFTYLNKPPAHIFCSQQGILAAGFAEHSQFLSQPRPRF